MVRHASTEKRHPSDVFRVKWFIGEMFRSPSECALRGGKTPIEILANFPTFAYRFPHVEFCEVFNNLRRVFFQQHPVELVSDAFTGERG